MYGYPSPPFRLSEAFKRAQLEESIISLEELTRQIREDKVFEELSHPISIDTAETQGAEDDYLWLQLKSNGLHLNTINRWSESEIKNAYFEGSLTDEAKKDEQSEEDKLESMEIIYPMADQVELKSNAQLQASGNGDFGSTIAAKTLSEECFQPLCLLHKVAEIYSHSLLGADAIVIYLKAGEIVVENDTFYVFDEFTKPLQIYVTGAGMKSNQNNHNSILEVGPCLTDLHSWCETNLMYVTFGECKDVISLNEIDGILMFIFDPGGSSSFYNGCDHSEFNVEQGDCCLVTTMAEISDKAIMHKLRIWIVSLGGVIVLIDHVFSKNGLDDIGTEQIRYSVDDLIVNYSLVNKAIIEGYEVVCKRGIDGSSCVLFITAFCGNILKDGGSEVLCDGVMDATLQVFAKLFVYLFDTDLYACFNWMKLARLLPVDMSGIDETEVYTMTESQQKGGGQFVNKMEGMITLKWCDNSSLHVYRCMNGFVNFLHTVVLSIGCLGCDSTTLQVCRTKSVFICLRPILQMVVWCVPDNSIMTPCIGVELTSPVVLVGSREEDIRLVLISLDRAEAILQESKELSGIFVKHFGFLVVFQADSMLKIETYYAKFLARRIYIFFPTIPNNLAFANLLQMHFIKTCPLYLMLAHLTGNQFILVVLLENGLVHVISFGKKQSIHWRVVLKAFSLKHGIPLSFRISGTGFFPHDNTMHWQEVGWKLSFKTYEENLPLCFICYLAITRVTLLYTSGLWLRFGVVQLTKIVTIRWVSLLWDIYYPTLSVALHMLLEVYQLVKWEDDRGNTPKYLKVQVMRSKVKKFIEMVNDLVHNMEDLFMSIKSSSFLEWLKRKDYDVLFTVDAFNDTMNHCSIFVGAPSSKVMYATLLIFLLKQHGGQNAVQGWNLKWLGQFGWTDNVSCRRCHTPELCGSLLSKYTPARLSDTCFSNAVMLGLTCTTPLLLGLSYWRHKCPCEAHKFGMLCAFCAMYESVESSLSFMDEVVTLQIRKGGPHLSIPCCKCDIYSIDYEPPIDFSGEFEDAGKFNGVTMESFVWDPGILFTTLRTRWLSRGRICQDRGSS